MRSEQRSKWYGVSWTHKYKYAITKTHRRKAELAWRSVLTATHRCTKNGWYGVSHRSYSITNEQDHAEWGWLESILLTEAKATKISKWCVSQWSQRYLQELEVPQTGISLISLTIFEFCKSSTIPMNTVNSRVGVDVAFTTTGTPVVTVDGIITRSEFCSTGHSGHFWFQISYQFEKRLFSKHRSTWPQIQTTKRQLCQFLFRNSMLPSYPSSDSDLNRAKVRSVEPTTY